MRKYLGFSDPVLPTSYPLELVKLLAERGVLEAQLLDGTTVTPAMLRSPKARLSFEQVLHVIQNATRAGDAWLGLEFGRRITVRAWAWSATRRCARPICAARSRSPRSTTACSRRT